MNNYRVRRVQQFPTYQVLSIEPEDKADQLQFWPGQYAALSFQLGSRLSPMRCFSMSNQPGNGELEFAMRSNGRFTRRVTNLQPGDRVKVRGPFGNFVLDPADGQIILLAAGIGITPFMSILRSLTEQRISKPVTLLYACRSLSDIPFADEIRVLQRRNQNLRVAFVIPNVANDRSQSIYQGRIDDALLRQVTADNFGAFTYFICGPKSFAGSLQAALHLRQVPEERIVTESFTQSSRLGWRLNRLSIPTMTYAFTGLLLVLGFGAIMALDILRILPKAAAATNATNSTTSSSSNTPASTANTSASTDNTASSSDTSNSSAATPSTTSTASSPSTNTTQSYQAPVSTVS